MYIKPRQPKSGDKSALIHPEGEGTHVTITGHGEYVLEGHITVYFTDADLYENLMQGCNIDDILADCGMFLDENGDVVSSHGSIDEIESD